MHDPDESLCPLTQHLRAGDAPWTATSLPPMCICHLLAMQRERIALAIEAAAVHEDEVEAVFRAAFYRDAARIARDGGGDG